jgi:hypothetical protein
MRPAGGRASRRLIPCICHRLVEIVAITDGEASRFSNNAADLPVTRFVQIIPPLTVAFDSAVQVIWRIAPR